MTATFYILALVTTTGFAAAVLLRDLVHCVLALTLGFAGLAMLFLELGAQFVGFTQILVYIGAVAILAVFAIMMTRSAGPLMEAALSSFWGAGCLVAASVFAVLAWAILSAKTAQSKPAPSLVSVNQIGDALMHRFALPLEIIGLLLTAALLGAVILAMPERRRS